MNPSDIISSIRNALKEELPGINAHLKVMPESRRTLEARFNPDHARKSAVLLLLYPDNGVWYLPFIQRTIDGTVHSGQIAFPGGKFEEGDADHFDTAKREAEEEIGIVANHVHVINSLSPLVIPVSNFIVHPVVGFLDYKPEFKMFKEEVADIWSVNIKSLLSVEIIIKTIQAGSIEIKAPFYAFDGFEVWGATAMILSEFIDVLKSANLPTSNF